jgi:nanoRNase/pAp phosphatase (c-di-AMP/oligoRNAs hydrolase)
VARGFGGGGHTEAAGCELEGSLDDVEARVLDRIAEALA